VIATRNGFEVFRFPVMQSSFSFTYVELLAVPTASLINNPGHLSTGESVFVGKKRLNTMCALENSSKVASINSTAPAYPLYPLNLYNQCWIAKIVLKQRLITIFGGSPLNP